MKESKEEKLFNKYIMWEVVRGPVLKFHYLLEKNKHNKRNNFKTFSSVQSQVSDTEKSKILIFENL
jgi:hypothetical protein